MFFDKGEAEIFHKKILKYFFIVEFLKINYIIKIVRR